MRVILLFVGGVGDLQVLDSQARDIIHGDLKVHRNWAYLFPALRGCWLLQSHLDDQVLLLSTLEFLYSPLNDLLLLFKLKAMALDTLGTFKGNTGRCTWHWELYEHLCREMVLWEVGPNFDGELEPVIVDLLNERVYPEWSWILPIDPVVHNKELSIRRVDRHRLHRLKVAHVHTLMEVAVVKDHAADWPLLFAHCQVVVED